jgi:hypothetical protein
MLHRYNSRLLPSCAARGHLIALSAAGAAAGSFLSAGRVASNYFFQLPRSFCGTEDDTIALATAVHCYKGG